MTQFVYLINIDDIPNGNHMKFGCFKCTLKNDPNNCRNNCIIADFINKNLSVQIVGINSYWNQQEFYIETNSKIQWDSLKKVRGMIERNFSIKKPLLNDQR